MTIEEMISLISKQTADANPWRLSGVEREAIIAALKAGQAIQAVLEHALVLEHLGKGSTRGWAEKALAEYNAATKGDDV